MRRRASSGRCEKSQSISRTRSAPSASARRKPARYAGPSPSLRGRWRTPTNGSSAASRSAIAPVAQLALEGKAKQLPGIGKTIEEKIIEVVDTGEMRALTKHRAIVPAEVVLFTRLPGLGPKTARRIWQELGITTLEELRQAAADERLRRLAGLGARSEERILAALRAAAEAPAPDARPLLGDGLPAVLSVVSVLREHPA